MTTPAAPDPPETYEWPKHLPHLRVSRRGYWYALERRDTPEKWTLLEAHQTPARVVQRFQEEVARASD